MLQEETFARHPQLVYLGKPFIGRGLLTKDGDDGDALMDETVGAIRMQDSLDYDRRLAKQNVSRVLAWAKRKSQILLSEEAFSDASRVDRRIIGERLCDLFGYCHILAAIRNQLTCIHRSTFGW